MNTGILFESESKEEAIKAMHEFHNNRPSIKYAVMECFYKPEKSKDLKYYYVVKRWLDACGGQFVLLSNGILTKNTFVINWSY